MPARVARPPEGLVRPAIPERPAQRPAVREPAARHVRVPPALLDGRGAAIQLPAREPEQIIGGRPPPAPGGGRGRSGGEAHRPRGFAGRGHGVPGRAVGGLLEASGHSERLEHPLHGESLEPGPRAVLQHAIDHRPHRVGVREAARWVHQRQGGDAVGERRQRLLVGGQQVRPPAAVRHQRSRRLRPAVTGALLARGDVHVELAARGSVEHQRGRHRLGDRAGAERRRRADRVARAHHDPLVTAHEAELRTRHAVRLAPLAQRQGRGLDRLHRRHYDAQRTGSEGP